MQAAFVITFEVSSEEEGGYSASAKIPEAKSALFTDADDLDTLYIRIAESVEGFCVSKKMSAVPTIRVVLPREKDIAHFCVVVELNHSTTTCH
jgi:hypothetical protein